MGNSWNEEPLVASAPVGPEGVTVAYWQDGGGDPPHHWVYYTHSTGKKLNQLRTDGIIKSLYS